MFQYYYTLLNSKDRQVYDDICRAFQKRFLVEIWLDNQLICAEVYLIPAPSRKCFVCRKGAGFFIRFGKCFGK